MCEILSERKAGSQELPIVALALDEMTLSGDKNIDTTGLVVKEGSFFELLTELERHPANGNRHHVVASYQAWIKHADVASTELFAAWFNVGVELAQLGDRTGAIDAYRKTLSIRPGFGPALSNLGMLLTSSVPELTGKQWAQPSIEAMGSVDVDAKSTHGEKSEHREKLAVLHVGCGVASREKLPSAFRHKNWQEIRLDIDPNVEPDYIASITDMRVIPDGLADAVYSSHNVEHLYPHEVEVALREMRRVLKPDGFVRIDVPDLQAVALYIAEGKLEDALYLSSMGPIAPLDILYGHRQSVADGNTFMAHRTGFTCGTLANALINAGFAAALVQRQSEAFALTAIAFRTTPEREDLEKADVHMLYDLGSSCRALYTGQMSRITGARAHYIAAQGAKLPIKIGRCWRVSRRRHMTDTSVSSRRKTCKR